MPQIIVSIALLFFVSVSLSQAPKIDPVTQKMIDLCEEQDKKAAASDYIKFVKDKETQTLEKYLKLGERPELCDLKYVLPSLNVTRKHENLFEKSLEKLSAVEKAEALKSRMNFVMKPLGRDYIGAAFTLFDLVTLRGYEMSLHNLKISEVDTWLAQFQRDITEKKRGIYDNLIEQEFRLLYWYVLNEPSLFPGRKPTLAEKAELIEKLEVEYRLLKANHICLLSEKCHYCVKEVTPKPCDEEHIRKKAEPLGEAGQIMVPKVWDAIKNINNRMKKFGNFE